MNQTEFELKWLESFAEGVDEEQMQKYVLGAGNLIWHIFSWELLPEGTYLEGDEAKDAFDKVKKQNAVFIEPFEDSDEVLPLPEKYHFAKNIDKITEMYVTDENFTWTYVKTHESNCGPYFYKK